MRRSRWFLTVTLVGLVLVTSSAGAASSAALAGAIAVCSEGGARGGDDRLARLADALAVAEAAVAVDDADPTAHFAVFCALGRRVELTGGGLASLGDVRRIRREVDRAIALDPDYAAALVGKARLLLRLPRLLGGDPGTAATLAARALAIEPENTAARDALADALAARATGR